MPEMTKYDHGVPSWVDLGTPDPQKSLEFYGALFGWEGDDLGEDAGHYTIVSVKGKQVAAISPAQNPDMPPYWTTYINVDDADGIAKSVAAAGGTVIVEPFDVFDAGRMAVFSDTTGAFISVWQPNQHIGAQLVNEAGAFTWSELNTSDIEKSKQFYGDVFGWTFGGAPEYAEAQVAGRTIAGIMPRPEQIPGEVPDHWLVYFGVDDVDKSAAKAEKLGAMIAMPPTDIPSTGRFAVILDAQGAAFAIFKG